MGRVDGRGHRLRLRAGARRPARSGGGHRLPRRRLCLELPRRRPGAGPADLTAVHRPAPLPELPDRRRPAHLLRQQRPGLRRRQPRPRRACRAHGAAQPVGTGRLRPPGMGLVRPCRPGRQAGPGGDRRSAHRPLGSHPGRPVRADRHPAGPAAVVRGAPLPRRAPVPQPPHQPAITLSGSTAHRRRADGRIQHPVPGAR